MNEKENEIYFIFHISKFFFPNLKFVSFLNNAKK